MCEEGWEGPEGGEAGQDRGMGEERCEELGLPPQRYDDDRYHHAEPRRHDTTMMGYTMTMMDTTTMGHGSDDMTMMDTTTMGHGSDDMTMMGYTTAMSSLRCQYHVSVDGSCLSHFIHA